MTPQEQAELKSLEDEHELAQLESEYAASQSSDGSSEHIPLSKRLVNLGKSGLHLGLKALNLPYNAVAGPVAAGALDIADAMGGAHGPPAFKMSEYLNGLNPQTPEHFPSVDELWKRKGVSEMGKLSDLVPDAFTDSGKGGFMNPEKGGALDFTGRGTAGGIAQASIDPMNWLSMGSHGADQALRNSSAVTQALGREASDAAKVIPKIPILSRMATAPSDFTRWFGKRLYSAPLNEIEHEGIKFGKLDVGDKLYNTGNYWAPSLPTKTQEVTNILTDARNNIINGNGAFKGGEQIDNILKPAQDYINRFKDNKFPDVVKTVQQMQKKLDEYKAAFKGTPDEITKGTPDIKNEINTGLLDESGKPITRTEVTPGTPEKITPGREPSIIDAPTAQSEKSSLYKIASPNAYNDYAHQTIGQNFEKILGNSWKNETEALSRDPEAIRELNDYIGSDLSTDRSQRITAKQIDRTTKKAFSPNNGTANLLLSMGAPSVSPKAGAESWLLKNLLDVANVSTMPMGYAMRRASESPSVGPMVDYLGRKALTSPWDINKENSK